MKVLIACESSGTVRDAFRALGHDAWSADLLPADDGSHYHIQGDVRDILDGMPLGTYYGERFCDLSARDQEKVNYLDIPQDTEPWDLMIAHPPCTYLSVSGMHWTTRGLRDPKLTEDALDFVRLLMAAPIPRICIENPVSIISTRIRKPDQIIQPWHFGGDASKKTCLWLKGLPKLNNEDRSKWIKGRIVGEDKRGRTIVRWANQSDSGQNKLGPSADRWKERSKTYQGIANAMAEQWSNL
jgi:site-specific DNA-cytosine methylase